MTTRNRINAYTASAQGAPSFPDRPPLSQDEYRALLGRGADYATGSAMLAVARVGRMSEPSMSDGLLYHRSRELIGYGEGGEEEGDRIHAHDAR